MSDVAAALEVIGGTRTWAIACRDCLELLRQLPDNSVQCCVTSPPYYALRDYMTGRWEGGDPACDHKAPLSGGKTKGFTLCGSGNRDGFSADGQYRKTCGRCGARRIDQQIGLEKSPSEYIAKMVEVFREVKRVLRQDGTLWLNIGDGYCSTAPGTVNAPMPKGSVTNPEQWANRRPPTPDGLKPKDLMMMPARLAIALQADGWYLRSDIIWSKPSPMPESTRDRPTKAHEYIFLLTKSATYYYDAVAGSEPAATAGKQVKMADGWDTGEGGHGTFHRNGREKGQYTGAVQSSTRNMRSVWTIATEPYPDAHFATFPAEIPRRAITIGTSEHGCCPACGAPYRRVVEREKVKRDRPNEYVKRSGEDGTGNSCANTVAGVSARTTGWKAGCECNAGEPVPCIVLDPFSGAGTTAMVARRLGLRAIGLELNPEYVRMSEQRIVGDMPLLNAVR